MEKKHKYKLGDIVEKVNKKNSYPTVFKITEVVTLKSGDENLRYVITSIPKNEGVNPIKRKDFGGDIGVALFTLSCRECVTEDEIELYSEKQSFNAKI